MVRPGSMAWLLRLLKSVDHIYSEECQLKTSTAPTRDAFMQIVREIKKINGHLVTIAADVPLQGGALEQVKRDHSCRLCQAEWESGPEAKNT